MLVSYNGRFYEAHIGESGKPDYAIGFLVMSDETIKYHLTGDYADAVLKEAYLKQEAERQTAALKLRYPFLIPENIRDFWTGT